MASGVTLEGFHRWDFDMDKLKPILRREGREVAARAKKLVGIKGLVSRPGGYPARRSGFLRKTIRTKLSRSGLEVVTTHTGEFPGNRYPFILVAGTKTIGKRKDYLADVLELRSAEIIREMRGALINGVFKVR